MNNVYTFATSKVSRSLSALIAEKTFRPLTGEGAHPKLVRGRCFYGSQSALNFHSNMVGSGQLLVRRIVNQAGQCCFSRGLFLLFPLSFFSLVAFPLLSFVQYLNA